MSPASLRGDGPGASRVLAGHPHLDLFGTGGGLIEHRAALLANCGYAVFALAFFDYRDLPVDLDELDLNYFRVCSFCNKHIHIAFMIDFANRNERGSNHFWHTLPNW